MNIYAKLTLLCVLLVVFTSSVLFIFANRQVERTFKDELLTHVRKQSRETISNVDRFIFSRLNDMRIAAQNAYFRSGPFAPEQLTAQLQALENLNSLYHGFSFYNNDRVRIADSKGLSVGTQDPNTSFWTRLNAQTRTVMDIAYSEPLGQVVMQFATVISGEDGAPVGVLVGRIPVNQLYRVIGDIPIGADSIGSQLVTLVDKDGTILYSNQESLVPLRDRFEDFQIIKNQMSQEEDVSYIETEEMIYFTAREMGYLNYTGNDWTLIVTTLKDQAFQPLQEIQKQLLWLILTVLAISIILALIVANIFVKPIVTLSQAAEEISKGNLNVEIKATSNDEIGRLASLLSRASQVLIKRLQEQRKLNEKLEEQKDEISSQKHLLEQVNKQISDSIVYAQRIQKSILPDLSIISKIVKDTFVFYEPKDVVSGDFYWFERVRQGRNEYLILVCADCTGHGVPGAIMSIMGSNQLTNIVYYQNYIDPNKILARLDKVIKFELQRDDENQNRDGLEIGICVINLDDLTMEFSGAGIPLHIVKKGSKELVTYKSPKYMIGGIEGDEKEVGNKLSKEAIQLVDGDKIYLATDGFQDQFGGPDDKKFMSKRFKDLIKDLSSKPMDQQRDALEKTFHDWKKDTPQTDDVLIIGVEI